jgi:hypothetical protein
LTDRAKHDLASFATAGTLPDLGGP